MALDSTYAGLQESIAGWLHRADLTARIPDLIALGETRIYREVRARPMEVAFSDTIASGVIALPTSYIELKYAYVATNPTQTLKRQAARWILEKYPQRVGYGEPRYIAREGSNFIFGPYPDSSYTISGYYYMNLGLVSASAHALFTENQDLYMWAALAEAEPYIKNDKRIGVWESKYRMIKDAVNGLSESEDYSGSDLQMTPG
jgi:hypothetical protein